MRKNYVSVMSLAIAVAASGGFVPSGPGHEAIAAEAKLSFKADVLPVLKNRCVACHTPGGEGTTASGLDLTTFQGVMTGTKYGPMVIPGNPDYSNLMWLLDWKASPQLRMPHGKEQLPVSERDTIRGWIRQGAKNN